MGEKQSRSSWFASVPGVITLLFFAVVTNYFQIWRVSAFLFLMSFVCSGALLWSRRVLRRVKVSLELLQGACHVGERLSLKLRVRNNSFFPLVWLDVIFPMGETPLMRQAGEEKTFWYVPPGEEKARAAVRQRFAWLLWQQEIEWREELETIRRGTVRLTEAVLLAGDGFGLSARQRRHSFPVPLELIVYPRLLPVNVQPFLKMSQEAEAEKRGQMEDVTLLKGSRPYAPGDPMKRINWRLLAGSGRMEANIYETVTPGCITFVLDLFSFRLVKKLEDSRGGDAWEVFLRKQALERMVSLAASCIRELAERRVRVALILPAYGERDAVFCVPGIGADLENGGSAFHEEGIGTETAAKCLEELARLDYRGERVSFPYEEFWQMAHRLGSVCICTCEDQKRPLEELAGQLGRSRVRYLAGEKVSGEASEYECLYGEDICHEPGIYLVAEKKTPKEVRIRTLWGDEEREAKEGEGID